MSSRFLRLMNYLFVALVLLINGNPLNGTMLLEPQVMVDSQGNATSVWVSLSDHGIEVEAVYKPVGKDWGHPETISDSFSYHSNLQVKMDRSGNIVVSWLGLDRPNETFSIYANSWDVSSAAWTGASQVSGVGQLVFGTFSFAICEGEAEAVWSSYGDNSDVILFTNKALHGRWESPSSLISDTNI